MMSISANVLDIIADVETELVFFVLAIGTHFMFFHKWGKGHPYSAFFNRSSSNVSKEKSLFKPPFPKSSAPNSTLSALKEALRSNDIKSAMARFKDLHDTSQNGDESPSSAPQMMMEQLVKLAVHSGAQAEVLQLLTTLGLSSSAFDLLLAENAGNHQEVQRIMGTMRTAGLKPTTTSFNKVLGGALASDVGALWNLIDEMKSFGVQPDQNTCAHLLKNRYISSKGAELEKVMAIAQGLEGEIDEGLFNLVIDACIKVGRADLILAFTKKERNSKRTTPRNPRTYASMIRAYGYIQDIKGAWDTWSEMRRQRVSPISVTLGCMVEALVTNGDIEGGYGLIHEMLDDEKTAHLVNSVMYGSIVKGFSHKKNFDRMWQVHDEMVAQKLQFSMVTYNTLIDACARSGELSRIPLLLKEIEANGLQMGLVTYSAIIKGYCAQNLLDDAFDLFNHVVESTDLQPDEIMFNTLLDGCARLSLYDRGMGVFDMMQQAGVRPSNYTLSVFVKLANRGKKLEKAFEICDELSAKYNFRLNVHVFANLIQACISHRDLPRAMGVLERMVQERTRPDVRSYSMLLRAFIEARQGSNAVGLLRAATGVTGQHPWSKPHSQLAQFPASALKPQGGLPGELVSEIVLGIMDVCHEERLASTFLHDIRTQMPSLKLDPKLRLRLAARMADQ